ncbi:transposase [Corallococcus sp. AB049A]|uniref:transposase n=1 Tax=Corallococcus sp. AB049A TaxID=2316721 RepID=UPI0034CFEF26
MTSCSRSDADWGRIEPLLGSRSGLRSKRGDRDFINAGVWRVKTGVQWRDLPDWGVLGDLAVLHVASMLLWLRQSGTAPGPRFPFFMTRCADVAVISRAGPPALTVYCSKSYHRPLPEGEVHARVEVVRGRARVAGARVAGARVWRGV